MEKLMARIKPDLPLVPSVLDRLLDDEPGVTTEPPRSRSQVLAELKRSVHRDLRNLLNTRSRCRHWPPELTELERSLVNYGLPDFTGAHLASRDKRQALCRVLENVIRAALPAFQSVAVRLRDDDDEPLDGTLRFHIDALLRVRPAPEPVAFDPSLELDTGNFKFEGPP
jgi:type VI secretion system protein ImpF